MNLLLVTGPVLDKVEQGFILEKASLLIKEIHADKHNRTHSSALGEYATIPCGVWFILDQESHEQFMLMSSRDTSYFAGSIAFSRTKTYFPVIITVAKMSKEIPQDFPSSCA